jgi:hypothetical protein
MDDVSKERKKGGREGRRKEKEKESKKKKERERKKEGRRKEVLYSICFTPAKHHSKTVTPPIT